MKTDILERTPKMEKSLSFVNLNHNCISPIGFSSFKSEEREERQLFNPCIIQHLGDSLNVLSPSKMLNLNSPLPFSYGNILGDGKGKTISKRLFFNFN